MIPQYIAQIQDQYFHMFLLFISLVVLFYGADFVLSAAELIGNALGIPPLVTGLIIVGFGTSLPEFFVSHIACLKGTTEIALGNVIGSNIANIFLIMGITMLIVPLSVTSKKIQSHFKRHLVLTMFLIGVLLYQKINYITSIVLFGFFLYFLYYTFKNIEKKKLEDNKEKQNVKIVNVMKLFLGFFMLYFGGELLVTSGSRLGEIIGISTFAISAVFVAFGTSFPELMTALVACIKKKDVNLITGNVIGSNIFNVAFVMGSIGIYNFNLKSSYRVEWIILLLVSIFLFLYSLKFKKLYRLHGIIFLLTYLCIVIYWIKV